MTMIERQENSSSSEDFELSEHAKLREFIPRANNQYRLSELLAYEDREFVRTAYRAILGREPDVDGLDHHLHNLRSGKIDKTGIIENLRSSDEGKQRQVRIRGLKPPIIRRLRHVPYLGYFIRWIRAFLYLPNLEQQASPKLSIAAHHALQNFTSYRIQVNDELSSLRELVTDASDAVAMLTESVVGVAHLRDELIDQQALQQGLASMRQSVSQIEADLPKITAEMLKWQSSQELLFQELRSHAAFFQELLIQEQRVIVDTQKVAHGILQDRLEELQQQQQQLEIQFRQHEQRFMTLPDEVHRPLAVSKDVAVSHPPDSDQSHHLDGLLAAFGRQFRGDTEQIAARLRNYLPQLRTSHLEIGHASAAILDLGCGRGEWLKILREHNYIARGVDSNRLLAEECRRAGLAVTNEDAVAALRNLPAGSLGAVTGFHIIEHLPFEILVELLDETVRVLRPGGVAIFETPNPKNLIVAACNFYSDPTHQRPVYPETIQFLLQNRGFKDVRLEYINPVEVNLFEGAQQNGRPLDTWFNWFYGPRDYAVIGRKA